MSFERPIVLISSNGNCAGPSRFSQLFSRPLREWLSAHRGDEFHYRPGAEIHLTCDFHYEDIRGLMLAVKDLSKLKYVMVHIQFTNVPQFLGSHNPLHGGVWTGRMVARTANLISNVLIDLYSRWDDMDWGMLVLSGLPLRMVTQFIDVAMHCEKITSITGVGVETVNEVKFTYVKAIIT